MQGGTKINNNIDALAAMLNKLNTHKNIYDVLPEIMVDLCEYLHFGCGFYYQLDYEGIFVLKEKQALYDNYECPEKIDLFKKLKDDQLNRLRDDKFLFFRSGEIEFAPDDMESYFAEEFNSKSLLLTPIYNEDVKLIGFIGVSDRRGIARTQKDDVTLAYTIMSTICNYLKLQITKEELDGTRNVLQSVTDNMGVDIYVNDFYTHEVLYANASMASPYGGVDKMIGETCWKVLYDDKTEQCEYCPQKKIIDENGNPTKIYSWDYQRPFDGSWFRVLSTAFEWIDGRLAHIVSSIDITDNKKNEEIIQKMALYDHLTGLPNRYRLTEDLDEMIPSMESEHSEGFVIFFDLDGFKLINDNLGHQVGDDLLKEIGALLTSNEHINNKCYRYGGDEFVILCYDDNADELDHILSYLKDIFTKPIVVNGKPLKCGASIGVSHYPFDETKTSELVRKADQAMYISKEADDFMVNFFNNGDICSIDKYDKHKKKNID